MAKQIPYEDSNLHDLTIWCSDWFILAEKKANTMAVDVNSVK